jgi:hypothetical protein
VTGSKERGKDTGDMTTSLIFPSLLSVKLSLGCHQRVIYCVLVVVFIIDHVKPDLAIAVL